MKYTSLLLAVLFASTLMGPASAARFKIDSHGAKPRKFRITAFCHGVDSWFGPNVYKSGLFAKAGKHIKEMPALDLHLAERDGQLLLLEQTGWQSGEYYVIGDASELDNMRLYEGVVIRGRTEWDLASQAWRVRSNSDDVEGLEVYQGELLTREWARDRLLAALTGELQESGANEAVLASAVVHFWECLLDANDDDHEVEFFMAMARTFYLEPMRQAAQGADASARNRLAELNQANLAMAEKILDRYVEDTWRPEVYRATFRKVIEELKALAAEL